MADAGTSKNKLEFIISMQTKQMEDAVKQANRDLDSLGKSGKSAMDQVDSARSKAAAGLKGLAAEARATAGGLSGIGLALGAGIVGGAGVLASYAKKVYLLGEEYAGLTRRIESATGSEIAAIDVKNRLYQASQRTGTAFRDNIEAYLGLERSMRQYSGAGMDAVSAIDLINKTLRISGANAAQASSFYSQFEEALQSGTIEGNELNAMLESNSAFVEQLAAALGTSVEGLRQMAENGQLTAETLRTSFGKMRAGVEQEFQKIPVTTRDAMQMLQNSFERIADGSYQASDGVSSIPKEIAQLAQTIDEHREGIIQLFSTMLSMSAKVVGAVADIGQSFVGWQAVFDGKLGFFEFATMDAAELNEWLKKNTAAQNEFNAAVKATPQSMSGDGLTKGLRGVGEAAKMSETQLKSMRQQYQNLTREAQRISNEMSGRQRSLAAELREMGRSGMSESNAWRDQKREAEEYMAAARRAAEEAKKAMAGGDTVTGKAKFEEAVRLADDARAAYKALNTEVREGDQVVLSKADALKTAMAGVKQSGELGIDILKQQQEVVGKVMDEMSEKAGAADLTKGMGEAEKKWLESWRRMKSAGADAVEAVSQTIWRQQKEIKVVEDAWASAAKSTRGLWIQLAEDLQRKLDAATKSRTVTVYTNVVEKHALGGLAGFTQRAGGGKLPGFGGGDRIPALLEAGEFVVRKEAVAKFGTGLFDALNHLRLPDLSELLPVPTTVAATAGAPHMTLELRLPGGDSVRASVADDDAERLRRWNRRVSHLGARR